MGIMDNIMEGAAGRWFKFDAIGATIEGEVLSITERQVRDFDSKQPEFWDDGEPKIEVLVALRTVLPREDQDDDGTRIVRIKGWGVQRNALREACQKFGRPPQHGDYMRATYVRDERGARGGFPAKVFEYEISEAQSANGLTEWIAAQGGQSPTPSESRGFEQLAAYPAPAQELPF